MIAVLTQLLPHFTRFAVDDCAGAAKGEIPTKTTVDQCNNFQTGLPTVTANWATVTHALQVVFGIMGVIAVVYIMYAAFHFTRSGGDPQVIAKARNGIIFALLGLAIVVAAEVIVTFVLGQV